MAVTYPDVDAYISSYPTEVQEILDQVRTAILVAVPGTEERISYQIPTVTLDGKPLVHYAAWKHHLAVYPVPDVDADFAAELAPYRAVRSTLRFRYRDRIPYDLIGRVAGVLRDQRGD